MKKIIFILISTVICIKAFSQASCYGSWPEWQTVTVLKDSIENAGFLPKSKSDELLSRFEQLKAIHDGFYYGTHEYCVDLEAYNKEVNDEIAEAALQRNEVNDYSSQCGGQLDENQYAKCMDWYQKLNNWAQRINDWKNKLEAQKINLDERAAQLSNEITGNNNTFINDARQALNYSVNILITRTEKRDVCTIGELSVNDVPFCSTLELRFDNAKKDSSSIPVGTYKAHIRYSTLKSRWVIELENVHPHVYVKEGDTWKMITIDRANVQIHAGNYQTVQSDPTKYNIKGCILVGRDIYECGFTDSKTVMNELLNEYFGSSDNPDTNIKVTVSIHIDY